MSFELPIGWAALNNIQDGQVHGGFGTGAYFDPQEMAGLVGETDGYGNHKTIVFMRGGGKFRVLGHPDCLMEQIFGKKKEPAARATNSAVFPDTLPKPTETGMWFRAGHYWQISFVTYQPPYIEWVRLDGDKYDAGAGTPASLPGDGWAKVMRPYPEPEINPAFPKKELSNAVHRP